MKSGGSGIRPPGFAVIPTCACRVVGAERHGEGCRIGLGTMTAEASNQGALRPNAAASGKRLAALVHDALKERLLEGEFAAGERLSPEALKAQFDV
ncbi:MAG: hypothetical protein ACJ786_15245, partial [Catenulispora sp.]